MAEDGGGVCGAEKGGDVFCDVVEVGDVDVVVVVVGVVLGEGGEGGG